MICFKNMLENDIVPIFVLKKLEYFFYSGQTSGKLTGRNYFLNIFYAPKLQTSALLI